MKSSSMGDILTDLLSLARVSYRVAIRYATWFLNRSSFSIDYYVLFDFIPS